MTYFEYICILFTELIEFIKIDSVNLLNEYGGVSDIEL